MIKIPVTCEAADMLALNELTPLQGDLKSLSEPEFQKLKTSLITNGFRVPFFVWKDGRTNYCVDGTQRDRVLRALQQEGGYELPEKYPVAYVAARDKADACRLILIINSQYGKMDYESLDKYLHANGISVEEIKAVVDLPQINIEAFEEGYAPEEATGTKRGGKVTFVTCPGCGKEFEP